MSRWLCCAGVLGLLLLGLSGCTLDDVAARQEKASRLWDELTAQRRYGQTFVSERANLYRIDLGTATYARVNSAPLIFHLRAGPQASTDLVSVILPAAAIQNERPTSIVFEPQPDSQGKAYYFYLESPQATAGDAVTVYANERDQYAGGTAYDGGQAVGGDLVFTAYSRQTFTLAGVWAELVARGAPDGPFFAAYAVLIGVCLATLGAGLHRASGPGCGSGSDRV